MSYFFFLFYFVVVLSFFFLARPEGVGLMQDNGTHYSFNTVVWQALNVDGVLVVDVCRQVALWRENEMRVFKW